MSQPQSDSATERAERLLVELVRRREERQGHPAPESGADEYARRLELPEFIARVRARALRLDGSDVLLQSILKLGRVIAGIGFAWMFIAALLGIFAAVTTMGSSQSPSLPLILVALVGVNLLSLLLWIFLGLAGISVGQWIAVLTRHLSRRWPAGGDASDKSMETEVLGFLYRSSVARWRTGVTIHSVWLIYSLAGLATLLLLLSFRSYPLSWQTTLLSPDALRDLAAMLSWLPSQLGAPHSDAIWTSSMTAEGQHRAWAGWLIWAVACYGLLPRLLTWAICLARVRKDEASWARNMSLPGFARLRARLMPDATGLGVVDPAPGNQPEQVDVPEPESAGHLPNPECVRVYLEVLSPEKSSSMSEGGQQQSVCFFVDDSDSRKRVLDALKKQDAGDLVVVVRASATADRGTTRRVAELAQAVGGDVWIALAGLSEFRRRYSGDGAASRLLAWRRLASAAGGQALLLELEPNGSLIPLRAEGARN